VPLAFKLIVGLGNPGPEHSETRHNAGFWFVDSLASEYSLSFRSESKFNAEICRIQTAEIDCWLCKPMTFMNRSGFSVQAMSSFYKISVEEILIAHEVLSKLGVGYLGSSVGKRIERWQKELKDLGG